MCARKYALRNVSRSSQAAKPPRSQAEAATSQERVAEFKIGEDATNARPILQICARARDVQRAHRNGADE